MPEVIDIDFEKLHDQLKIGMITDISHDHWSDLIIEFGYTVAVHAVISSHDGIKTLYDCNIIGHIRVFPGSKYMVIKI